MQPNSYRSAWAAWLSDALPLLAQNPPDYSAALRTFPKPERAGAAAALPNEPLRLAVLTSSGAYWSRRQAAFAASSLIGDSTHRVMPIDLPQDEIAFAQEHFDHTAALADPETIVPRTTLREAGVQLTDHLISWTGYCLDWPAFIEQTIPQMIAQARADGANAALVVPV